MPRRLLVPFFFATGAMLGGNLEKPFAQKPARKNLALHKRVGFLLEDAARSVYLAMMGPDWVPEVSFACS